MKTIIQAIIDEQKKLLDSYKEIDIAIYHRRMKYLEEAVEQLQYYQRECR